MRSINQFKSVDPLDDLLTLVVDIFGFPAVYTPGSDIAAGSVLGEFIWGRLGNDALLAYQPLGNDVGDDQLDLLVGDFEFPQLLEQIPADRNWGDTFILGDWRSPYYTGGNLLALGANNFALIPDFETSFDTLQLYGQPENYQITDLGIATLVWYNSPIDLGITTVVVPDLVAVVPVGGLDLSAEYFRFVGDKPAEPVFPEITQIGTPGNDISDSIAVDPFGGVWVTGSTTSTLTHDSNVGSRDFWLKKYDAQGTLLFKTQLGSPTNESPFGIVTDSEGNVIIVGVSFGEFAGVYDDLSLPYDGFNGQVWISKYDQNGDLLWLRNVTGTGNGIPSSAFGIDLDADGNIYISGVVNVPTPPGSALPLQTDNFFSKFSPDGEVLLYSQYGNSGVFDYEDSYNLAVDLTGNSYRVGFVTSDWAGLPAQAYDGYLAKNDSSGALDWVVQITTDDVDWLWAVDTDSKGDIVVTGWTLGSLPGTPGNLGSFDAILAKYNASGEQLWAKHIGTQGDDVGFSVKVDNQDFIYAAGYTDNSFAGFNNEGGYDFWVAKFAPSGETLWLQQYGTSENDQAYDLALGDDGSIYITGITDGSFGEANNGSYDVWIAKVDSDNGTLLDFSGRSSPPVNPFETDIQSLISQIPGLPQQLPSLPSVDAASPASYPQVLLHSDLIPPPPPPSDLPVDLITNHPGTVDGGQYGPQQQFSNPATPYGLSTPPQLETAPSLAIFESLLGPQTYVSVESSFQSNQPIFPPDLTILTDVF